MEIYITYVSHGDGGGKLRPVLVFEHNENIAFAFNITTQYENKSEHIRLRYFPILDWRQSGLLKLSYVDTNTIKDYPRSLFANKTPVGKLTIADRTRLIEFLKKFQ